MAVQPRRAGQSKAGRRQLDVAHCVLDVAVAQSLKRPDIDAVIGELEAACVPQHVRMNRETEIGGNPKPRDHLTKRRGRECRPGSDVKIKGDAGSWSR
jgi:hypothetical protein